MTLENKIERSDHADRLCEHEPTNVWYSLERVRLYPNQLERIAGEARADLADIARTYRRPTTLIHCEPVNALIMCHVNWLGTDDVDAEGQYITFSVQLTYREQKPDATEDDVSVEAEVWVPQKAFLTSGLCLSEEVHPMAGLMPRKFWPESDREKHQGRIVEKHSDSKPANDDSETAKPGRVAQDGLAGETKERETSMYRKIAPESNVPPEGKS